MARSEVKGIKRCKSRNRSHGTRDNPKITIFKSNGLAVEDVAAAGYVYERGLEAGIGRPMASLYS